MCCRIIFHLLTFYAVLQSLVNVQLFVLACTEDFQCPQNSSTIICCSGTCKQWWKCEGGCMSDDTCNGGNICFRNRCEDPDIDVPDFCSIDIDCLEEEECESGQCKPAPRPVVPDSSGDLHVSFNFDRNIVIYVGAAVGSLIFLAVVGYGSYRCYKRNRRRRLSRGVYSAPTHLDHGVNSFSPSGGETYVRAVYSRSTLNGSSGFSYPPRPPPEYDSLTLDSNLDVESSSPPPYDQNGETASRTSDEAQVFTLHVADGQ